MADEKKIRRSEDDSFVYAEMDDGVQIAGKNGRSFAHVRASDGQLTFYAYAPFNIPKEKRQAVATFIMRVNYGSVTGHFDLNADTGLLVYRTSVVVRGTGMDPAQLKSLVEQNIRSMERYLPGVVAIVERNADPRRILAQIESKL